MSDMTMVDLLEGQTHDLPRQCADDLTKKLAESFPPPWSAETIRTVVEDYQVNANRVICNHGLSRNPNLMSEAVRYFSDRLHQASARAIQDQNGSGAS